MSPISQVAKQRGLKWGKGVIHKSHKSICAKHARNSLDEGRNDDAAGPTARKAPDIGKYIDITGFITQNPVVLKYLPMSGAILAVGPAASSGTMPMKIVDAEGTGVEGVASALLALSQLAVKLIMVLCLTWSCKCIYAIHSMRPPYSYLHTAQSNYWHCLLVTVPHTIGHVQTQEWASMGPFPV